MELKQELVDLIVNGKFAKATFDFQSYLKSKYNSIKDAFTKEYKIYDK